MRVPLAYDVGVCTHTGRVRVNNEDDYLLGSLGEDPTATFLCAVADGMGGAVGGAEASRTALRALGATVLDGEAAPAEDRLRNGFLAASRRVFEQASAVPALREMGTTLTALSLSLGRVRLGHVGDTRAYLLRGGALEQLTVDHAVREPDNLLTKCIGGGQATCEADFRELAPRPGDRFLLASDGIWGVVPDAELARLLRGGPQAAAEALVAAALAAGGPDNATAVVVDVRDPAAQGVRAVDLPRDERPGSRDLWPRAASLRAPWWPWFVLAAALVVLGSVVLRWAFGVDAWALLASSWSG